MRSKLTATSLIPGLLVLLVPMDGSLAVASKAHTATVRQPMQIARKGKSVTVILAPAVQEAVRRHFPGYRLARFADYDQDVIQSVTREQRGPFHPFAIS